MFKSEFNKNVLTLMTGTTIAQAIPIAISPILTRIYTPEDFGVFALFLSILTIIGSIIDGRYHLAILVSKNDDDAINVASLGLSIATCFSILIFILIIFMHKPILKILENSEIGLWLYFMPLVFFAIGLMNVLQYLNIRKKNYTDITKAKIYKSILMVFVQLIFVKIKSGATGLITGYIVSIFFSNYLLSKKILHNFNLKKIKITNIKILAKRYISFPKFSLTGILMNSLSKNLVDIFIPIFFNLTTLGFYSLAQRLLLVPTVLIGSSISQVFFKEASVEKINTGKSILVFKKTLKKLTIISIPLFSIIFFISEDLFSLIFGETWRISGQYCKYLIPMIAITFIVSAVTPVDTVMEKQKFFLFFNIIYLTAILFIISMANLWEFENFLIILSSVTSIIYLIYLFFLNKMAKNEI